MQTTGSNKAERQSDTPDARLPFLSTPSNIVLASASPRRRELLSWLGISFRVIATDGEEHDDPPPPAVLAALPACPIPLPTHPTLLAWRKASAACANAPDSVIIGADTLVVLDDAILGKPRDTAHAHAMLRHLSGRTHTVYTGLVVMHAVPDNQQAAQANTMLFQLVTSNVVISNLTDAEIEAYIATGEPMDKAGAYGIQGLGGQLVRAVYGSYTSVVGLPLTVVARLLTAAGVRVPVEPSQAYLQWLQAQGKEPLPCPPTFP